MHYKKRNLEKDWSLLLENSEFIIFPQLIKKSVKSKVFDKGLIIYLIAEKLPPAFNFRIPLLIKYTLNKKIVNPHQLDMAIKYLKEQGENDFCEKDFEEMTGVYSTN